MNFGAYLIVEYFRRLDNIYYASLAIVIVILRLLMFILLIVVSIFLFTLYDRICRRRIILARVVFNKL